MARRISDIMTADPVTATPDTPVTDVARLMRESDIGDVVITEDGTPLGIITDRDITVRVVADGRDPGATLAADVSSADVVTCAAGDSPGRAVQLMREHALRRLPVVEDDRLVGTVALGDLARDRDPKSALADISAAPPNT